MPTQKRRLTITLDDWMVEAIEEYRKEHLIDSKAEAISKLIETALVLIGKRVPTVDYSEVDAYQDAVERGEIKRQHLHGNFGKKKPRGEKKSE